MIKEYISQDAVSVLANETYELYKESNSFSVYIPFNFSKNKIDRINFYLPYINENKYNVLFFGEKKMLYFSEFNKLKKEELKRDDINNIYLKMYPLIDKNIFEDLEKNNKLKIKSEEFLEKELILYFDIIFEAIELSKGRFEKDLERIKGKLKHKFKKMYIFFYNKNSKEYVNKIFKEFNVKKAFVFSRTTVLEISIKNVENLIVQKYYSYKDKYYIKEFSNMNDEFNEIYDFNDLGEKVLLKNEFDIIKGHYLIKQKDEEDSNLKKVKLINIKDINDIVLDIENIEYEEANEKYLENLKVEKYDIVFSVRGFDFKSSIILDDVENEEIYISNNVGILRLKNKDIRKVTKIFALFQTEKFIKSISGFGVMLRYKFDDIYISKNAYSEEVSNEFLKKLEDLKKIRKIEKEIKNFFDKNI